MRTTGYTRRTDGTVEDWTVDRSSKFRWNVFVETSKEHPVFPVCDRQRTLSRVVEVPGKICD